MLPDYAGGSLLNLVASLASACGGAARHAPLAALDANELAAAHNVVLLIVDGLGDGYLRRRGGGGELERRRRAAITSVFPSTTASAITTTYTGASTLEHGLTGWFSYFGAAACVGAPLPFIRRGDSLPLQQRGFLPERAFQARTIFESIPRRSIVITWKDIVDSAYNVHHCRGAERRAYEAIEALPAAVETAVKSGPERKFVYAYFPEYDRLAHRYGSESERAFEQFAKVDAAFGRLLALLSGTQTAVVATADHGFIDVAREESLELPPQLASLLRFPLCGERRVAYCHVQDRKEFIRRAADWLGERADVLPSEQLVAEGWFGPGSPCADFGERAGDVALVMRGRYTIKDWVAGEPRHLHIGNHGGTSEEEMLIPLIFERT